MVGAVDILVGARGVGELETDGMATGGLKGLVNVSVDL